MGLFEFIAKSRSGVYKDTSENRRLHRVGQRYGITQQVVDEGGGLFLECLSPQR